MSALLPLSEWFSSLPQKEGEALLSAATPLHLTPGEFAYRQGEDVKWHSGAFFGVSSGLLKMSVLDFNGKEAILAIIEPGNWFGEVAVLNKLPRGQSVVALTDSRLLTVSAEKFAGLMQRSAFAEGIARLLARRLSVINGIRGDSALLGLRERVARRLVMLVDGDLVQPPSLTQSIGVSQGNLAMLLGISRVTLNKELRALVATGAIALHYGRLEVKDLRLLIEIGNGSGHF
jgi:CRP/FNR family cyclic AMP-dependent transcriptional regulator